MVGRHGSGNGAASLIIVVALVAMGLVNAAGLGWFLVAVVGCCGLLLAVRDRRQRRRRATEREDARERLQRRHDLVWNPAASAEEREAALDELCDGALGEDRWARGPSHYGSVTLAESHAPSPATWANTG